jgi:tRNA A-37 threonylcarbamoyl transferase component Bud32
MPNIILGKLIDKRILATIYECTLNKKKYIAKIEHVTKNDKETDNNLVKKEINFSLKFGNKYPDHFMVLIDHYFEDNCNVIKVDWDIHNPPKVWRKKLVNEYTSIINEKICLYKIYTKMDVILNNVLKNLTHNQIYSMLLQVSYSMNLLHSYNYIHGDLHCGNVGAIKTLKKATIKLGTHIIPTFGYQWKLIDFGLTLYKEDILTKDDNERYKKETDVMYDEGLFYALTTYIQENSSSFNKKFKQLKKSDEFKIINEIHSRNSTIQEALYMTLFPDKYIEIFNGTLLLNALLPIPDLIFFAKNGMHSDATFQYLLEKLNIN